MYVTYVLIRDILKDYLSISIISPDVRKLSIPRIYRDITEIFACISLNTEYYAIPLNPEEFPRWIPDQILAEFVASSPCRGLGSGGYRKRTIWYVMTSHGAARKTAELSRARQTAERAPGDIDFFPPAGPPRRRIPALDPRSDIGRIRCILSPLHVGDWGYRKRTVWYDTA